MAGKLLIDLVVVFNEGIRGFLSCLHFLYKCHLGFLYKAWRGGVGFQSWIVKKKRHIGVLRTCRKVISLCPLLRVWQAKDD